MVVNRRRRLKVKKESIFSRLVISPYKMGSLSAKKLAEKVSALLGKRVRRVKPDGKYRPRSSSVVLNWGSGVLPSFDGRKRGEYRVVNRWNNVSVGSNKVTSFEKFKAANIPTPDWTLDASIANRWLVEGHIVLSRTLLNSHSGRGIIINKPEETKEAARAPLYVKYKKKRREFRVHVFNGQVVDLAEKRRFRQDRRDESFVGLIRNHGNGWAFCRNDIVEPNGLRQLAVQSVAAVGLDFGACDIIWNEKEDKCYTLEVNTAPGLEGTTLERYSNAIANYVKSLL